eukprot:757988-Hanusia_phi.AAC.3
MQIAIVTSRPKRQDEQAIHDISTAQENIQHSPVQGNSKVRDRLPFDLKEGGFLKARVVH